MSDDPILTALADLDDEVTAGFDRVDARFAKLAEGFGRSGVGFARYEVVQMTGFERLGARADAIRQDIAARLSAAVTS